ncbi:MAG: response regulator [Candidatus Omnitrophota bacterium]|nr:response regulator [Candidatus Omnitrophota bacterium]MDZ4242278.1 response regulator [Candidatus Omnitrophota bacterium]
MHRILIVDDNFENRQLLAEILREVAVCDFAASGKEAIEAYNLSLQKGEPYSLILLDIELPEVNGLEILEKIRESERSSGIALGDGIKIIIVTAYEKRFLEAFNRGCDDYILKPIDTSVLLTKIASKLEQMDD